MPVIIRTATPHDFPAVLALIHEFAVFQQTPGKVTTTLEQMQDEAGLFKCLVAETGDGIVGFASFFLAYYSWTGKALYLDDLYVTAAYRKQGIGQQLLEAVAALAREAGCRKLRWQVSGWNANAIDFYTGMGATIDRTEINCDLVL